MVFKILLCLLIAYPCYGLDDTPVTFENLLSRLTQVQIEKVPELAYLAELKAMQEQGIAVGEKLSQDIDYLNQFGPKFLSPQLYTLYQLERELGQNQVWLGLATQLYEQYGIKPEGINDHQLLWWVYYDLAKAYYTGENTAANPALAFEILTACARQVGCEMLRERLLYYLNKAEYLPDTRHLDRLWTHDARGVNAMTEAQALRLIESAAIVDDDTAQEKPDDALFHACTNVLGSTDQVIDEFNKQQEDLLNGDPATPDQVRLAYQAIGARNDISGHKPVTFSFSSIGVKPVLSLLWEVMATEQYKEASVKFAADLPDYVVEIRTKRAPAILVLAQLLAQFKMEVKCHENWVLFKPQSSPASVETKKLLIANFITQYTYDEDSQKADIRWGEELSYTGEVSGHMPHGEGQLMLFGDRISGQFKQGVLHGSGEWVSSSGHISMIGQFENGSLHGKGSYTATGEYLSDKARFVGDFKQGLFYGNGVIHLSRDSHSIYGDGTKARPNTIEYNGPIIAGEPDGTGQCSFKTITYSCTFHRGHLISFNEVSLLPVKH